MASALHFILLVSVWLLATSVKADDDDSCMPCPPLWTQFGKRCFLFNQQKTTWTLAERYCLGAGGNLASIRSAQELAFVRQLIKTKSGGTTSTWAGGHDGVEEKIWQWSDGTKFDFKLWTKGEPNNFKNQEHCMQINYSGREVIYDSACFVKNSIVCSKDL